MAVSSLALTLPQYALMSNSPLVQKITYSLLENGSVLTDIPLVTRKSMIANGVRFLGNLPLVNWGKLNTDPVVASGTPTAYQEQAYLIRNAIDVDRYLVQDENAIVDPRGAQASAFLKSVTYDFNDKFINNDPVAGNADAPVGLKYRIANGGDWGVNPDMSIDAGGVNMTATSAQTAITSNQFIVFAQQMLDYMGAPDGNGVVLYMNDYLKRNWEYGLRISGAAGGFRIVEDAFGRSISMYKGARVVDIGRKADQTTRIISNTENSNGTAGSSNYTSMYGVRYGGEHFIGWQFDTLEPEDIGLIGNGGTVFRTLFDWACGLYPQDTRCMARIFGIKTS